MQLPNITFGKSEEKDTRIFVGIEKNSFSIPVLTREEKKYVDQQLEKDKNLIVINRYDYQIFILKIKEEKTDVLTFENARNCGNSAVSLLKQYNTGNVIITDLHLQKEVFLSFIEGLLLGNYNFGKYKKPDNDENFEIKSIVISSSLTLTEEIKEITNLIKGVFFARDIINEPVNYLNSLKLAAEIKELMKETGVNVEIFEKKKIESLRMGGLLAVNKGSIDPPTFSILEWKPSGAVNDQPIVLVGKGLVYDTGGLSLKPTKGSMDEMKCDMSGAAAVAGAVYAIAKNRLPVYVVGLIPSTDNRPGGNAYTPGDIITMHNGKTVEVLNTDAEGRLILADALSYADKYKPELAVTVATLTGSAQMAIGNNAIVGMGNIEKDISGSMQKAGDEVHERVVLFPFWDEYADEIKSDIADMKNIGGKVAGAITAGKFLEKFTTFPFFHLDIAGPAFLGKTNSYRPKGGTGIGVRLLYRFVKNIVNTKN